MTDGSYRNTPLCGDRACRSTLAAAPCEFVLVLANPLRRSCVSKRSRCGAVRFRLGLGDRACRCALASCAVRAARPGRGALVLEQDRSNELLFL